MVHILHWLLASGVSTAIVRSFFFLYYDAAHSPDQAGTAWSGGRYYGVMIIVNKLDCLTQVSA